MNAKDVQLLYQYNEWANFRILDAAGALSRDQLNTSNSYGWGSFFGGLAHILDAEYYWRNALSQAGGANWVEAGDFADLAALRARWESENAALREYIDGLSDEQVAGEIDFEIGGRRLKGTLWHFLLHLYTHSVQHRSECAALLSEFGHSPGDMDFGAYLRQAAQ